MVENMLKGRDDEFSCESTNSLRRWLACSNCEEEEEEDRATFSTCSRLTCAWGKLGERTYPTKGCEKTEHSSTHIQKMSTRTNIWSY